MKKLFKKQIIFLALLTFSLYGKGQVTKNVLKAPCNCDGELELTYVGATLPLQVWYSLPRGIFYSKTLVSSNKDTIKNLCQGYLTVDASGFSFRDSFSTFAISNVNVTHAMCPNLGSIGVTFTGSAPPFTYSCIDRNGTLLGTTNPISVPEGDYLYTLKDANGCTYRVSSNDSFQGKYDTISIKGFSNINYIVNTTVASCTNGTAAITGITGGTAPYSYHWFNGANTSSINGLTMGSYKTKVIDATGCSTTRDFYVQQGINISTNSTITPATCIQSDGAAMAFGSGGQNPYTYKWNTGAATQNISGLKAGSYQFTATDNNGCIGIGYVYINASTPIIVNYSTTPSSCTTPTGSATINITGGTTPYTTTWFLSPSNSSGVTLNNKSAGNYSFQVVDNLGCLQSGAAVIPQISTPIITYTKINPICPANNGSINISASGVSPMSYSWSNGSTGANISGLAPNHYVVTVTDGNSCKNVKGVSIDQIPSFSLNINSTNVSCIYSNDGSATVTTNPGGSYIYNWSNGTNLSTASNLKMGRYYVTVTALNGCKAHKYINIENNATSDACYCTVKGRVYHDANNNCTMDAGENGIDNIMMHMNTFGSTFTNSNGDYSFQVPTGTYKLSQEVKSIYPKSSCQVKEYNVSVTAASGCVQTFNFADSLIPSHDLFIATMDNFSAVVPGEIYEQRLVIKNIGNVPENSVKVGYKHDNQLTLQSTTSDLVMTSSARVDQSASYPSLNPGTVNYSYLFYQVPTNIPMNTQVIFQDTVAKALPLSSEWLQDLSPWNNVNYYQDIVVSSYDPNSKEVLPKGEGADGIVPKETKQLAYTINFQNLGTYHAKKVVLIDTLDKNLDMNSLSPITASHKFETFVEDNGVVRFIFDKIYLPAEMHGGKASNGFITYTINLQSNLEDGTQIKNFADIYFDYNEPIRTNTTLNTIEKKLSNSIADQKELDKLDFQVYPNPAIDNFTVNINTVNSIKNVTMEIYDLNGKVIYNWSGKIENGENKKVFNTENISNGFYIINLNVSGELVSKKLMIDK